MRNDMREILFRGKRKDNGEWVYGDYGRGIDGNTYIKTLWPVDETPDDNYEDNWTIYAVIPETVGQYTGLKDKNGVKIFEGDIVHYDENEDPGAVEYLSAGFGIGRWNLGFYISTTSDKDLEVIGNIHDNPELLGGEIA
jgi:hypothetical protein